MRYAPPSAPPYPSQYAYAVPYQQQQMYSSSQARPPLQQQQHLGTGTAMLGGFVLGAVAAEMLDPTEDSYM
jgi:hypothetical protein